jgi:cytochrome c553
MMKPLRSLTIAAALTVVFAGNATAADIDAGKKKAQEVCAACHNMDGISTVPDYPKLAGQYPDYLAKALRDYKSGARKNPIMAGFAQSLSDKDIVDLAAYFAAQPSVLTSRY